MKEKWKNASTGMVFRMIVSVILMIFVFEILVSLLGYQEFTESLTREYEDSARRTAESAAALVDGDQVEEYLADGGSSADYTDRLGRMNILCQKQDVTLIYVIAVDTSDYGSFRSVFNTVREGSGYTPWEVGYSRQTTNEEYRDCYEDLYQKERTYASILRTSALRGLEPHITTMVPVYGSDGSVKAITCVQRPMEELKVGRRSYLDKIVAAALLMAALSTISVWSYLHREFVRPIHRIMDEAARFSKENVPMGAVPTRPISQVREIQFLWDSLQRSEKETEAYIQNLTRVTAENERIGTELELARQIQANMLPNIFPPFPERDDFDIYATMTPAKEVGGDFYDFFLIDDDHLGMVMADVSGKGIPAALVMMMSKILISNLAMLGGTPGQVLERANNAVSKNNDSDMFVTAWFGILTLSTGELIAANAGHEYPVLCRTGGRFEIYKDQHRLPIGAMTGTKYVDYRLNLAKGDVLFLYTDGLPEATDFGNRMLGTDRMLNLLNEARPKNMRALLDAVQSGVAEFVGTAPQFDDLTMLALRLE